jgi:hypothetical protein
MRKLPFLEGMFLAGFGVVRDKQANQNKPLDFGLLNKFLL